MRTVHMGTQAGARTGRWLRLPVGIAAVALTLASCASLGDGGDDGGLVSGSGSDESGAPLLQVVLADGFVPMGWDFSRVPELTVYGDGRAINHGPQIEIWPAPALPNLVLSDLSEDDVAALVEAARDAGLLSDPPDYGQPPVADAPTTYVTLTVDGETYVHAAPALGIGDGTGVDGDMALGDPANGGLSEEAREGRVALAGFIAEANELVATAASSDSYEITAFGVMARPAAEETVPDDTVADTELVDPAVERQVLTWPLDLSLADASECVAVDGDDAATLLQTLGSANVATLYEQAGVRYDTFFRPLLPHESGCEDLR